MERRTDLAVELKEDLEQQATHALGVTVKETKHFNNTLLETYIKVTNETGAKQLGKPMGTYITLESSSLLSSDKDYHKDISNLLSKHLTSLLKDANNILVLGLGNQHVTPDALGPYVVDHLNITRHLKKEGLLSNHLSIYAIAPGVMAQTGMEASEIIKGIISTTNPQLIIAIDALAARSSNRLNRTIQLTNTGITPGSGVGNQRARLDEETLGIPVIAIGVPTVIAVPTIICDAMDTMLYALDESVGKLTSDLSDEERYLLATELISPYFSDLFVTPKNIDEEVLHISYTISEAINQLS